MKYEEALKQVQSKKPKENFMVVTFGYNMKLVISHKEGMALIAALANAEELDDPYNGQHRITGLDRSKLSVNIMSHEEYETIKISALLGVSPKELAENMKIKIN